MAKHLFGTDGIRGVAGEPPLDPATAHAFGFALGTWIQRDKHATVETAAGPEVVLGMDTRESGPWLADHVAGGLRVAGVEARFAGVITTPGIAYLTRSTPFAAGVMISASHNPYHDNGLKVIGPSGYKLPDAVEIEIENLMRDRLAAAPAIIPVPQVAKNALDDLYAEFLLSTCHGSVPFHLAIDCANGSAARVAPPIFDRLQAKVEWLGVSPDGRNINLDCGSLHLEHLQALVVRSQADLGIAFDGDADRALFVAASGRIIDGDAILFLAGSALKRAGRLRGDVVVATVMSNLGLERAFAAQDIRLLRTPVGDKYVLEEMLRTDAALGGEQSGHVIFSDYATTGDGILTALRVLEILRDSGQTLDDLAAALPTFPQKLVNVRVRQRRPLSDLARVQSEISAAEREFAGSGRILVRFSGTEPLARVMIEAASQDQVDKWTGRIADALHAELG